MSLPLAYRLKMMTDKCRNRNSAQPSQKSQVLFFWGGGGDGFDFFLFPLSSHQVPKGFSTSSQRVLKVFNVFPMAYPICFAKVVLFVMHIGVMQALGKVHYIFNLRVENYILGSLQSEQLLRTCWSTLGTWATC
jgi:hypothetical protein